MPTLWLSTLIPVCFHVLWKAFVWLSFILLAVQVPSHLPIQTHLVHKSAPQSMTVEVLILYVHTHILICGCKS